MGAKLRRADLREAELVRFVLSEADIYRADLTGVRALGADLRRAVLVSTNLTEAALSPLRIFTGQQSLTDAIGERTPPAAVSISTGDRHAGGWLSKSTARILRRLLSAEPFWSM